MNQGLIEYLSGIEDPRIERTRLHKLTDILVMAIVSTIGGAEGWEDMELFCKSKEEWLCGLLSLKNGIPSDDTFRRVLSRICPRQFQNCVTGWLMSVHEVTAGQISIDGKTLRRSFENADRHSALHLVQAWSVENSLVLGQLESEGKKNEIKTIPKLLEILDISGCIVTLDAMGCQKAIAEKIIRQGGDYVLSLKGNQGATHQEVSEFLNDRIHYVFRGTPHDFFQSIDGSHGRIEVRKYWVTEEIEWMQNHLQWEGLSSIGVVESTVEINQKITCERRYFLSSMPAKAEAFAKAVRGHWAVENSLHWVLDVTFREDESRIRKDHGAENVSWLRKWALALLKKNTDRGSIRGKRKKAGWNHLFLEKILTN